jgi:hypothetical protein
MSAAQCGFCVGYLTGPTGQGPCRHGVYRPNIRLVDGSSLSVETLAKVFNKSSPLAGVVWRRADAHRLAVPLAAGLL